MRERARERAREREERERGEQASPSSNGWSLTWRLILQLRVMLFPLCNIHPWDYDDKCMSTLTSTINKHVRINWLESTRNTMFSLCDVSRYFVYTVICRCLNSLIKLATVSELTSGQWHNGIYYENTMTEIIITINNTETHLAGFRFGACWKYIICG